MGFLSKEDNIREHLITVFPYSLNYYQEEKILFSITSRIKWQEVKETWKNDELSEWNRLVMGDSFTTDFYW